MSVLTAVQSAANEMGITPPNVLVGSAAQDNMQLLALANRAASEIAKESDWVNLQRLQTITTVNGQAEYDLPTDFDHYVDETAWDRSSFMPFQGPLTPQEWQAIKSGLIGAGMVGVRYRVFRSATGTATKFTVDPTPSTNGDMLVSEYISSYWATTADGVTAKSSFTLDSDLFLLPENLLTLSVIWRYLRAKGIEYTTQADEYNQALDRALGRNRPAPVLLLSGWPRYGGPLLGPWNIPDGGYGS